MPLPSYEAGLLQAKAYRLLKTHTGKTLQQYGLTMAEWAVVGHLMDISKGLRLADLSTLLGVEPPLVTRLVDSLEDQQLVRRQSDKSDRRAKRICLSAKGGKLVVTVETAMRQSMKELLVGVGFEDLQSYLRVLRAICNNAQVD
jgi:DNA-binding MarR family transcriptional regulator